MKGGREADNCWGEGIEVEFVTNGWSQLGTERRIPSAC